MKILHLPTAVGNHGYSLACAERRLGMDSQSLVFGPNKFEMESDWHVDYKSKVERLTKALILFGKIRKSYDVYHFNFCKTLLDFPSRSLDFIDLDFYKGAKFATFNGSDIRRSVDLTHNPFTPFPKSAVTNEIDELKKARLNSFLKKINFSFVLNPDLMAHIPPNKGMFLPYIKQSWFDSPGVRVNRNNKKFTIVHAPTNRKIKGSETIIQTVQELKRHFDIEFILLEGMSHDEAKKSYSKADLLIDQIRIGWYGGVAVEAMRMGVPVAVYINPKDLVHVPPKMRQAIYDSFLLVNEKNLFMKIAAVIDSSRKYEELVDNSLDYVNEFHDPDKNIKFVMEKYREFA